MRYACWLFYPFLRHTLSTFHQQQKLKQKNCGFICIPTCFIAVSNVEASWYTLQVFSQHSQNFLPLTFLILETSISGCPYSFFIHCIQKDIPHPMLITITTHRNSTYCFDVSLLLWALDAGCLFGYSGWKRNRDNRILTFPELGTSTGGNLKKVNMAYMRERQRRTSQNLDNRNQNSMVVLRNCVIV